MADDLTKKQKGFIKDFVKTGNATQSALNNYDTESENVAGVIGSENLKKPKIQEALKPVLERYQNELNEILTAMELKDKNGEQYKTLVDAADTIQKQIQLLSGKATDNINLIPIVNEFVQSSNSDEKNSEVKKED